MTHRLTEKEIEEITRRWTRWRARGNFSVCEAIREAVRDTLQSAESNEAVETSESPTDDLQKFINAWIGDAAAAIIQRAAERKSHFCGNKNGPCENPMNCKANMACTFLERERRPQ